MKKVLVLIILFMRFTNVIQAQDIKVAIINKQELVEQMPSYLAANIEIKKIQRSYQIQLAAMKTELQKKSELYEREIKTVTSEISISREKKIEEALENIKKYEQSAFRKLQEQEKELLKGILEKVSVTIQKVAREKGYNLVLDSTPGAAGVILADVYDLMPDVKANIGL